MSHETYTVASHNIMHGYRLRSLLPVYTQLRVQRGLDILCLQENRLVGDTTHAQRIAHALGDYCACSAKAPGGVAIVHSRRLACVGHDAIPLPILDALKPLERLYIKGGQVEQRYALILRLRLFGSTHPPLTVVNLHLETAGTNRHRRAQVKTVAKALTQQNAPAHTPLVVCGDTNAFSWRPTQQAQAITTVMEPLRHLGLDVPPLGSPTHFFSRADEPMLPHRLGRFLGRLGLDMPRRYDIVCTNLERVDEGQVTTPDSDHDLLWLQIRA